MIYWLKSHIFILWQNWIRILVYLTFSVILSTVTWRMTDCHQSTHFVRQIVAETIWHKQYVSKSNDNQLLNLGLIEKKLSISLKITCTGVEYGGGPESGSDSSATTVLKGKHNFWIVCPIHLLILWFWSNIDFQCYQRKKTLFILTVLYEQTNLVKSAFIWQVFFKVQGV